LLSPRGGKVPLDEGSATEKALADPVNARFLADASFTRRLENSLACRDAVASRYVAIYLAMFDFRQSPDLQRLLTAFADEDRFIAGVCHGVAGLVGAGRGARARERARLTPRAWRRSSCRPGCACSWPWSTVVEPHPSANPISTPSFR